MNKNTLITLIIFLVLLVALVLLETIVVCRCVRHAQNEQRDTVIVQRTDTLVLRDTVRITNVEEIERRIIDTIYVHTIDSVLVQLPRERVWYKGEDYYAAVSGIEPSLDTLAVYPKTKIVTNTVEKTILRPAPRWSFGVTAGPGIMIGKDARVQTGIGVVAGIQYRF